MDISFYRRPLVIFLIIYSLFLAFFLKAPKTDNSFEKFENIPLSLQGAVVSYPLSKNGRTNFILKLDKTYDNKRVYVSCYKEECKNLLRGSKLFYTGTLETLPEQENRGSFDWGLFLKRKNISAQSKLEEIKEVRQENFFWITISKIRRSILTVFENNFNAELLPILSGITLGEKGDIPRLLYTAFQDSGAMHLLVASGGNVGFITLIVYFLCSLFGLRRFTSAAAALTVALVYTLIAGADAPLLRAYLMAFCSTVGFMLGRKSGLLQGFVLAALVILLINPQSLFEAGFQMSFLATLSIMLFAANFTIKKTWPKHLKILTELFLISLVAQLSLTPLFCNYFHKLSLTAPLSNILLIPLSGILMGGGFLVWLLSFLPFGFILKSTVFAVNILLVVFKFLVEFFAALPISKLITPSLNPFLIIIFYLIFFAFLNLPLIKNKKRFMYLICFLSLVLAGFSFSSSKTAVLTGRYNFVVIEKQNKLTRVFGAGVKGEVLRNALLSLGTKEIDCLFVRGSASSLYALKDLEDIEIKNIYLRQDYITEKTEDLLKRTSAKINLLWPKEDACGVRISKEGNLGFSYQVNGIELSDNMKRVVIKGQEKFFKQD